MIQLKRVYLPAEKEDGYRILVDRLWPRGVTKERAKIDFWAKNVSPSPELRTWYSHEPEKWDEFSRLYSAELDRKKAELNMLRKIINKNKVATLVYGAKDEEHTHAIVLAHKLKEDAKK